MSLQWNFPGKHTVSNEQRNKKHTAGNIIRGN
ncbi:hypothetical protein SARI_02932 [Salmonella enterica subsp. arizonae serovar 62:z4,z23:-]|uniref:Uncharacterized protein n=1 Tax=Salmonella arizonae (strain ATCC BAA-731 / CDC346-86 / RSK2980) TaxID=41514 RepID=A9MR30_SALAR|nr:hypothetical protein SARI_02932 [Salmonella enterica subsp. arizonae serovar 62:z4,z23:-]